MGRNTQELTSIREELEHNGMVIRCAKRYGNTGDPTSMKMCYLLHHHPDLSVSQLAELAGVSISAASRCLKKLNHSDVVASHRDGRTVYYSLETNEFTDLLVRQLERGTL